MSIIKKLFKPKQNNFLIDSKTENDLFECHENFRVLLRYPDDEMQEQYSSVSKPKPKRI